MRFNEIISEAIPTKPYNVGLYFRNTINRLSSIVRRMETAQELMRKYENGDRMAIQLLRYGSGDYDSTPDIYSVHVSISKLREINNLVDAMKSYVEHGPRFLRYVQSSLQHIEIEHRFDAFFKTLSTFDKGAEQYGYDLSDPVSLDDEYHEARQLVEGVRLYADALSELNTILTNMNEKVGVLMDRYVSSLNQQPYRPAHGEVETLYHASAFVPEILKNGFESEKPVDRQGLGNLGVVKDTISFTHDLEIARNIMRTLKEVCMIAHGQLTSKTILGWIRKEKLDADNLIRGAGIDASKLKNTPEEAVILYRYWIGLTGLRVDPMMVHPQDALNVLMTRKVSDIGVLACDVELSGKDEYLSGEAEFRVPPSRVRTIKQIL
jgi:hypothetical protein